jgi:MFS family permease
MSYQVESAQVVLGRGQGKDATRPRVRIREHIGRTVLLLGATSLLTDISSEMVSTVLPIYIVFALGASPLQFGIVDGIYQGATAFMRLLAGVAGDRTSRHKPIAAVGYGISAVCKLGLVLAGSSLAAISAVVYADRVGKGIRTAPRDALISLTAHPKYLGAAFGVHRAMDTAGAMIGPLLAFGLLAAAPRRYDAVFVVSFCFAIMGLAVITLLVRDVRKPVEDPLSRRAALRNAFALLHVPAFRRLTVAAGLLGLATLSDGFLYLGLQDRMGFAPRYLPLLYVGTAIVFMVLAVPMGRLADRVGRGKVFVGGYVLLLAVYSSLVVSSISPFALILYLAAFGVFYAATDGVVMALASALLPEELRGSGMGLLTAVVAAARLFGAVAFGALWTLGGVDAAVLAFAGLLTAAIVLATAVVVRREVAPVAA